MPTAAADRLEQYAERLERARTWARQHLDENPGLADMAAAAAFSPFHFHRIFQAASGETPAEHLRRLRLEKAAGRLLYLPGKSVTEIGLASGWPTPSAFARDFRARFGETPTAFRRRRLAAIAASADAAAAEAAIETAIEAAIAAAAGRAAGKAKPAKGAAALAAGAGNGPIGLVDLPAMTLAYVPHYGPYGPGVGAAWGKLLVWAKARGLVGAESRFFGVSWDDPELAEGGRLRYDACLPVPAGTASGGRVLLRALPQLRCLAYAYAGPESGLSAAYVDLYYRCLPASGLEPADFPVMERYRAFPRGLVDPRFDVEIYLPVRGA